MTDVLTIGSQRDKKIIDAEVIRATVDNLGLYWWSFQSTFPRLWLLSWPYFKSSTVCSSNTATTISGHSALNLRKMPVRHIGEATTPKSMWLLPPTMCRQTICAGKVALKRFTNDHKYLILFFYILQSFHPYHRSLHHPQCWQSHLNLCLLWKPIQDVLFVFSIYN